MAYAAEISRSNPGCILFLIDQSGSMSDPFGADPGRRKAEGVADALNRLLGNLLIRCSKDEGLRDYYHVGIIGYGGEQLHGFGGEPANRAPAPISEFARKARVVERTRKAEDGAGGLVEERFKMMQWVDPVAAGKTPMCRALDAAREALQSWVQLHNWSYPPIVINVTDGQATDGDPLPAAQRLRDLATGDGNVLLFNCHISSVRAEPMLFPDGVDGNPDEFARLLFELSSPLPEQMVQAARGQGLAAGAQPRGFAFNADMVSLISFLDIGTRPANLR